MLMFAFGNESNYGLSWSSFEIENLPEGERNTAKARYLYSLFNEVMAEGKRIAPNHPFSIVNGDLQYIDLIAELCPALDVLGSNVYRGKSFTSLWRDVSEKLDLPVLFFEFGSDAFNARAYKEDQRAQAEILRPSGRRCTTRPGATAKRAIRSAASSLNGATNGGNTCRSKISTSRTITPRGRTRATCSTGPRARTT